MNIFLKVKLCSLAEEGKIIRRLERKLAKSKLKKQHPAWKPLHDHRRMQVRKEARATGLAYGFLRGRDYKRIENKTHTKPDWANVERMVLKYSTKDSRALQQQFEEWKTNEGTRTEVLPTGNGGDGPADNLDSARG